LTPSVPRRPPPLRGAGWLEALVVFLCAVAVATVHTPYLLDLMALTFLWAGLGLAWNIAGGYAGLISFGHAAFFGIGAYSSTILFVTAGVSPWVGMCVGALLAALFGAGLTLLFARLRGPFFILSTLAIAEVVRIAAVNARDLTGGSEGLSIPPLPSLGNLVFASKQSYAVMMLAYLAILVVVSKAIERARIGYRLCAVRDEEDAAAATGIDPLRLRTFAMMLSAGFTGIGGTLFAQYFLYLDPLQIISPDTSFQIALLPAFGGIGTTIGPILGAFVIIPASELLRGWLGDAAVGLHLVIYGVLLIVVMLRAPGGLADGIRRSVAFLRRRGA